MSIVFKELTMVRLLTLTLAVVLLLTPSIVAQEKRKTKPNINESKEFPGVFHSPSADSTPRVFRSVIQLEIVVKRGDKNGEVIYADGTVVTPDGLIAAVLDEPRMGKSDALNIDSVALVMLDGSGAAAQVVSYDAAHGVAILRVDGLQLPHLTLSKQSLVAQRRVNWHAVYRDGRKTFLYSRPLRIHKPMHAVGGSMELCQVIDLGTSALSPERSGSALVALDGSLVALMGRQEHWHVTPKSALPRKKLAWAVPAEVIAKLLEEAKGN